MTKQIEEYVDADSGHVIRVYENGMEYNMSTKRIHKPPQNNRITSENASEFARKRWQAAEDAAIAALAELQPELLPSVRDASIREWQQIVKAQAIAAKDAASPYATKSAEFVGKATGFLPTRYQMMRENDAPSGAQLSLHVDKDTASDIASKLAGILADRQGKTGE